MDTDINTCLERRIKRDTSVYGMDEKIVKKFFYEIIIPIYKSHIEFQRDYADIVIRNEGDKKCLIKKLQTFY